jgi:hypothetical protein
MSAAALNVLKHHFLALLISLSPFMSKNTLHPLGAWPAALPARRPTPPEIAAIATWQVGTSRRGVRGRLPPPGIPAKPKPKKTALYSCLTNGYSISLHAPSQRNQRFHRQPAGFFYQLAPRKLFGAPMRTREQLSESTLWTRENLRS